jgi:hypothetical protein
MADKRNLPDIQEEQLHKLTIQVEQLRRTYEQYLLGHEKIEPTRERDRLERVFLKSNLMRTPYSTIRFRFQNLVAGFRTHMARWDRIRRNREKRIEKEIRTGVISSESSNSAASEAATAKEVVATPEEKEAQKKRLSKAAKDAQDLVDSMAPPKSKNTTNDPLKPVYEQLIKAKEKLGQDVSKLDFSTFKKTLDTQRNKAQKKLGVDVSFRVAVKGDRVSVIPEPLKKADASKKKKKNPAAKKVKD